MALNKQVQIYSIQTNAYYTDEEYDLDQELNKLRNYKKLLKNEKIIVEKYKKNEITKEIAVSKIFYLNDRFNRVSISSEEYVNSTTENALIESILKGVKLKINKKEVIDILDIDHEDIFNWFKKETSDTNKKINDLKEDLLELLKSNTSLRTLRNSFLNNKNVISIFESSLTRTLEMDIDTLCDDLIVVRVFYFDIAKSIVTKGFMCNGEKYIFLSSSAGQIRTKKMVFIKETAWIKHHNTITCGLSLDKINATGGVNTNKYIAYLALCNSATDLWEDFDMTKAIVVDDLETNVTGEVDFFDDKTYEITRKVMDVPITHTDGCGMMLPKLGDKSRIFRAPWIKGLLTPFPFDTFILENGGKTSITDIYGKEYDILQDDIHVIFTKSQFKMWKYYNSWDEYLYFYKKHNCKAGYCNEESDEITDAKINYQMLQTLTDITDDELNKLAEKTNNRIKNITSNMETIMDVFGANHIDENSTYLQQAIHLYPEILIDTYTKEKIKLIKASIIKNARGGRLNLYAKYTFIIPDLYAYCEYLFLGNKNPDGLLKNGEVYCSLFKNTKELDCLRSPHLDNAHAVRKNISSKDVSKWFVTKGLYTSVKDLISKMLQFDNDGDTALVCGDSLLNSIAKRSTLGDVPMYYNMAQGNSDSISKEKLFQGLSTAFTAGNIGEVSNDITKIWNSENIDLQAIKILCAETNFTIDMAKTLYKPQRPKEIDEKIRSLTKSKLPYFFKFAKDKEDSQVEKINDSTVNRLYNIIRTGRLSFKFENESFDYRMLMKNKDIDCNEHDKICKIYDLFKKTTHNSSSNTDQSIEKRIANFKHKREKFVEYFYDIDLIVDVLVKYLYSDGCNSKYKDVLWYSFGDILIRNLKTNMERKYFTCDQCGKKFYAEHWNQKYCKKCSEYNPVKVKTVMCKDCGKEFEVDARNMTKDKCTDCYKEHRRIYAAAKKRESRIKNKVS